MDRTNTKMEMKRRTTKDQVELYSIGTTFGNRLKTSRRHPRASEEIILTSTKLDRFERNCISDSADRNATAYQANR